MMMFKYEAEVNIQNRYIVLSFSFNLLLCIYLLLIDNSMT